MPKGDTRPVVILSSTGTPVLMDGPLPIEDFDDAVAAGRRLEVGEQCGELR